MARIKGPYTILKKEDDRREPLNSIDQAKEVIFRAMEGLDKPPKPVKWWKPLKESIKPLAEQKDSSLARLGIFLNPNLRINVNRALSKKTGKYTDIIEMLKSHDEKDYISGLDEIRTGIDSGGLNIGASLGTLLLAGTDLVANTEFLSKFEELMKKSRPEQPETWRGELISLMTSFGVPGSLVTKVMARAGKVEKIS